MLGFRSRNTEDLVHEWNQVQAFGAEVSLDIHRERAEIAEERDNRDTITRFHDVTTCQHSSVNTVTGFQHHSTDYSTQSKPF